MIDHLTNLFFCQATISMHRVPVLFVHVVTRLYFGVVFAELDGSFRIAFDIKLWPTRNARQQEKFFTHSKNEGIFTKGHIFSDSWFGQAVVAYFFNVQSLEAPDQLIVRGNITEIKFNSYYYLTILVGSVVFKDAWWIVITIQTFAKHHVMYIA